MVEVHKGYGIIKDDNGDDCIGKLVEENFNNTQQAKCAMLPCQGYYESMCELCIDGSCYRKP